MGGVVLISIIVGLVIGVCSFLIMWNNPKLKLGELEIILSCIAVTFAVSIIIPFAIVLDTNLETRIDTKVTKESEYEIVSLDLKGNTEGSIGGSFFLGIGSVKGDISTEEYYYYYINDGGKYKMEKVPIEGTSIIEYDGTPKVTYKEWKNVKIKKYSNGKLADMFGLDMAEKTEDILEDILGLSALMEYTGGGGSERILYIPKGSIKTGFNPNLQK